ncbi:hypothetical protein KAR52_00380 [Candidatus Pacearchaeota archaeon]|nr:hypothetical protein [Candidatus Pacearchaeota archaeon]
MKKSMIATILGILLFVITLNLISAVLIVDVSSSPEEVAPGQIVEISIEIENIFDYDVKNLHVKLELGSESAPFAPYQSSSEKFIEELNDREEETFKFKLITLPETSTGIYKIRVNIDYEYEDENSTLMPSTKEELISIIVNSQPELKISSDESSVLILGEENSFSIKIINSGLSDVKFVYLTPINAKGIKFLSEKEQYIGDINSDDFDSIEYQVYLEDDASGTIILPVILKFKDATNKEFIESKNLILRTYSLKEAQDLGLIKKPNYTIYIVIGILVLGCIFYRIRKKKKLKVNRN